MKTTKIVHITLSLSIQNKIDNAIQENEKEGYQVVSINTIEGNTFSKYTCNPQLIIMFQKEI
jgi:hypothetical protein